jgi:L-ascorbate metabolism protein UlaG (beta-lactamase superfamily)
MGPADALRAVQFLKPQHVIPIHYDTFPLIHQDAAAWAKSVGSQTSSKVHLLQPGQSIDF